MMAKHFKWRVEEGQVPSKGPYIAIRTAIEVIDPWSLEPLPFRERYRRYTVGFYLGPRWHFKMGLQTVKRLYPE
jgi:hypothetical protein